MSYVLDREVVAEKEEILVWEANVPSQPLLRTAGHSMCTNFLH